MEQNDLAIISELISHFAVAPEKELNKLIPNVNRLSLKKNEYFLQAGEIPDKMGFIVSGLMKLYYIDANGTEVIKHFAKEQTCAISYSAFIKRDETRLYIQALEDTKILYVNYETYANLLAGHECWSHAAQTFSNMLFIIKEKREAELLLNDASERYDHFLNEYPGLENRINQYNIAAYLGITPESLSRIRSQKK